MAFFKTDEEKIIEEEKKLKAAEEEILKSKKFWGKVGQIHQGLSTMGLWGVRDNGKTKFKRTKIEIYDDKILIERNRLIIQFSQIKDIFQEKSNEAIIILDNGDGIPIQATTTGKREKRELKAFLNILNKLIEDNKSNSEVIVSTKSNNVKSEDKFDKLIKLGEMHDKGLLSDEEFASLKQELLSGNNEDAPTTPENNIDSSTNTCENCGAEVSNDDAFCSECGTQIN